MIVVDMFKKKVMKSGAFIILAMTAFGCGANESVLRSGRETPIEIDAANAKTALEKDLDAMRTAGFTFIYVLRRRDGGVLAAEDIGVIKLQTSETNRRVKTDNDRAVIIGTNNAVPPNNLAALYDRFAVDNYSEPPAVDANVNANSNK